MTPDPPGATSHPERLAHYRIIKPIGAGGMAEVYLAHDSRLEREVALKLLPERVLADDARRARFFREARATAALNHPNIVTVYGVDEVDGRPFIAMELVDGTTLTEHVPRGGLDLEPLLDVGIHLADAVHAAHSRSIVHRDLKPANVMVTWDGRLKVLDFGLAALRDDPEAANEQETTRTFDEFSTRVGVVIGTPGFMAPEQIRGAKVDHRADLFGLGAVLYFAATGSVPFAASTAVAASAAVLNDEPEAAMLRRPELPSALGRLLDRLLAKDPDRRVQTALDVRNELEDLRRGSRTGDPEAPVHTLAVLPFADMSPERDQDYLCEGLAEELIGALSKVERIKVAARSSAFRFAGSDLDLRDIGRQLAVDTVLEGSVRKAGERLRVTVQMVDVVDGYQLWSERFDRGFEDIFAVQDEIAERAAEKLRGMLSEHERQVLKGGSEVDPKAYELYLRGRHIFARLGKTHLAAAREVFRRAIEIDPDFALAWAGLSLAHSWEYQWWRQQDHREPGLQAAMRALELAPNLAEAHMAMGWARTHTSDHDEAEEHLRRALELDPDYWEAHWMYGRLCLVTGRHEEAVRHFGRAADLNPDDYQALALLVTEEQHLGHEQESIDAARRGVERVRRAIDRYPDDARAHYMGAMMLLRLDEREWALEWARRAEDLTPGDPATLYNLACFYAIAGKHEQALDTLEKTLETGFGFTDWIDNDPDLDVLRDDPRFAEIRARLDA